MAQQLRTVIVTGSNKGVGFGIVENLATKPYHIVMACRSIERANESRSKLIEKHPHAKIDVLELDVDNKNSITQFVGNVQKQYGQVDVLLNNVGMAFKGDAFNAEVVEKTFATNFYGTIDLSEKMIPFIKDTGKIIFVGSSIGKYRLVTNPQNLALFQKENLTKEELFNLSHQFYEDVKDNTYEQKGWAKSAYGLSKLCINTYASVLSRFESIKNKSIQVYACCPGWVRTDMAGDKAPRSIEEGAVNPVYLVDLPFAVNPQYQGKFFYDQVVTPL